MFLFLGITNVFAAIVSFIKAISMYDCIKNSYNTSDYASLVWFFMISSIINAVMFFKLHRMEKRTIWLTDIAKKNGYEEPKREENNDIYKGDGN